MVHFAVRCVRCCRTIVSDLVIEERQFSSDIHTEEYVIEDKETNM